ncbi:unnamed protein product, partial [Effrenium voratum]
RAGGTHDGTAGDAYAAHYASSASALVLCAGHWLWIRQGVAGIAGAYHLGADDSAGAEERHL